MAKIKKSSNSPKRTLGNLIIIGGHEDKEGEMKILTEVAKKVGTGKLCIATVASSVGDVLWKEYYTVFKKLGVKSISHLDVVRRNISKDKNAAKALEGATAVFFTGGDQLKITSELGGTSIAEKIREIYENGGLIAGTSAGASVMSETMLVSGPGDSSYQIGSGLKMAPGLGYAKGIIIDQHFAERGRFGRLLGAVAQNPKYLGIGIDEDTSIILDDQENLRVLGKGAVYVVDAHESTDSNISDARADDTLSLFNVKFHVLSDSDEYNFRNRLPSRIRS